MTTPDPRVWNDAPEDPAEPWVWPPDETHPVTTDLDTVRIYTNPNVGRHYTLEPDIDSPGFWKPEGTENTHEWAYWLQARWLPLTDTQPA